MKKVLLFIVISLLLIGLVAAETGLRITASAVNDEKVCCKITPVVENQTPSYSRLRESECDDVTDDGEPILGANKEIVDDSYCEDSEEDETHIEASSDNHPKNAFCGSSTLANCSVDGDCGVGGCSNQVCQGINEEPLVTTCEYRDCYNAAAYNANCRCIKNKCRWNKLTQNQVEKILNGTKRIKPSTGECPEECTCAGSTVKCELASGREMTVRAGNSGNVIVQVKGIDGSTKVTLYKAEDGKIYGVFKGNVTRRVKMFPDQVKEKIMERIRAKLQNENITLSDDGTYKYEAKKRARLFFIIPVRVPVKAEIDSETGEVIRVRPAPWWAFLARDEAENIVGASCGTVTPGYNDECCQNKGYDVWNSESQECEFNDETQAE